MDDDQIDVVVTATVTPPRSATRLDPATGWAVEIVDMTTPGGLRLEDETWRVVETTVADDPAELIGAWIDANDRDADDAADMRRDERRG